MQRVMIFIDYENFDISWQSYYRECYPEAYRVPWLDIARIPSKILERLPSGYQLVKTFLFAPEPDDFLMSVEWRKKRYDFLKGLGNVDFFTVVFGRHVARPTLSDQPMDPEHKESYYVDEKGSDINISVQMITKAFLHAYDTALVMSGDTDYIPIYDILNTIGKTVIVAGVKGQSLSRFKQHSDLQITLDMPFFESCLLTPNTEIS
ncbi:MAG: NYN domain-containing protein [Actinomycetia bacterium]|nr:NYN domain-containing protein [Actinomycetes bacterium]